MNRAIAALLASTFALVSASAFAADGDTMPTPKERPGRPDGSLWWTGDFGPPTGWPAKKTTKEREAAAKERAAKRQAEIDAKQKAGAANKPTNEERQKHLTEQSKKGSGQ
jgi:hypothetical protein